jgi:hypothetical protein
MSISEGVPVKTMAEVLAEHQKVSMGMTYGSPDTCKCGARIYPAQGDTEVTLRRDAAFGVHQFSELAAAGFGDVREAGTVALEEAAAEVDQGVPAYGQEEYADWLRARAAAVRGDG